MADSYYRANYSGDTYNRIILEQHIYTVATDLANLRTTERTDLYMVVNDASSQWWNLYGSEAFVGINGNNKTDTVTFDARSTGTKMLISSWDTVVQHNIDGTAEIGISAHHYSGVGLGNASITDTYNCDTLVVTPTFTTEPSITSKTETTITINRGATDISSNFYYSVNNGNWIAINSNSTTISNLSPNTSYSIVVQARNSNNESYVASKTLSETTYQLPTQTIMARTETTIKVNWHISTKASHLWYSIDGGNTWVDLGTVNSTFGTYTISGLSANTTYNLRTALTRAVNGVNAYTSARAVKTYNYPTISVASKTVNSITVNWSMDETANHLWVSLSQGESWIDIGDVDAGSGQYTIGGLSPDHTYTINVKLRRSSTNSESISNMLTETTYKIAYLTEAPDITIGQNATIKWDNPSGAESYIYIESLEDSSTVATRVDNVANLREYTFQFSAAEINSIYSKIPNKLSGSYRYVIRTRVNGVNYFHWLDRTFYVDREASKPIFTDFDFEDVNDYVYDLTDDRSIIVNGLSNVQVTIPATKKATAQNGASMSKYRVTIQNKVNEITYSSSEQVSAQISNANSATIKVDAIDSRGLETTVLKSGTFKDYSLPTIKSASISRENGVGTKALLDINGTYWNGNFGNKQNAFRSSAIRFKKTTESNWGSWIEIGDRFSGSDGNYSTVSGAFVPTANLGTVPYEFELGYGYDIQIMIFDEAAELNHIAIGLTLDSGVPCTDKIKNSDGTYSVGINQLADSNYALAVKGNTAFNGKTYHNDETIFNARVRLANNQWNSLGDDFSFGDVNAPGKVGIYGETGNTGIRFYNHDDQSQKVDLYTDNNNYLTTDGIFQAVATGRNRQTGTVSAGATTYISISDLLFGLMSIRVYGSYTEILRVWAMTHSSRWASSQNLICEHNYMGGGSANISIVIDPSSSSGSRLALKIDNTGSIDLTYVYGELNII